jgi:hypothetical protein
MLLAQMAGNAVMLRRERLPQLLVGYPVGLGTLQAGSHMYGDRGVVFWHNSSYEEPGAHAVSASGRP